MTASLYGYISDHGKNVDPGVTGQLCPICHTSLLFYDVCFLDLGDAYDRRYFYRAHETCYMDLTPEEQNLLDSLVWENIALDLQQRNDLMRKPSN